MKKTILKACFFLPVFAVTAFLSGCFVIGDDPSVSLSTSSQSKTYFNRTLIHGDDLKFSTQNFLNGTLRMDEFNTNPDHLIQLLEDEYVYTRNKDLLDYMADICFNQAENELDDATALSYYLSSAVYSYALLFYVQKEANEENTAIQKYSPYICQCIVRYNTSLNKIFCFLNQEGMLLNNSFELKTVTGTRITFHAPKSNMPYPLDSYKSFTPCSEFQINDLSMVSQTFGIGLPIVAVIGEDNPLKSLKRPKYFPQASTVLLHFYRENMSSEDEKKDMGSGEYKLEARFWFLDSTNTAIAKIADEDIPIYRDFSTQIAAMTKFIPPEAPMVENFFRPREAERDTGLYMLENYNPNMIPVVFVHGLMSNPLTWMRMINMLNNYPEIRDHYQFWMFKYSPTSPLFSNAYKLKIALLAAERELATTPQAKENFNKMVLVGHSMGGLLNRIVLQDDPCFVLKKYWADILKHPIPDELNWTAENVDDKAVLNKDGMHFVKRVVMMAVPHRGAAMAKWHIAQWIFDFIDLQQDVAEDIQTTAEHFLLKEDAVAKNRYKRDFYQSGVRSLHPDDTILNIIQQAPFASNIPRHSIIGNNHSADEPGGSDGIVPYSSSHLDNVTSELVVKSPHNVQKNPAAIIELIRILRTHLKENCGPDALKKRVHVPFVIEPKKKNADVIPEQSTVKLVIVEKSVNDKDKDEMKGETKGEEKGKENKEKQ